MSFKAKLDMPIILVIILIVAVLAVPVFLYFPSAISAVFVLFIAAVVFGCLTFTYKLSDKWLSVRFGILGWRFGLDNVKELVRLKKPYRFKLIYGTNFYTYLSVQNPEAFSAALRAEMSKRESLRAQPRQE
jgi:uncharacterized membrane protein AbrB (regulator of aidB expression)